MSSPRSAFVAVLILASSSLLAQSYRWAAFVGLPPQYGSSDGTGPAAHFYNPQGVCGDSVGNVYVADSLNHTIRRVSSTGVVVTLAGSPELQGSTDGAGAVARFRLPSGITIASGSLFVTDQANHTIRRVTSSGTVTTYAGQAGVSGGTDGNVSVARFYYPTGIASDSAGNLYVTDRGNQTIRKISTNGNVTTIAGSAGVAGAIDGVGSAARFRDPSGIVVGAGGVLYVSDTNNHTVRRIAVDGRVTTVAGQAGVAGAVNATGANARFHHPAGLIAFSDDSLLVADSSNSCLRSISPTGVVTLFSGRLNVEGYQDGSLTVARYYIPLSLTPTSDGGFAIADARNHSIRKISPARDSVSTLAGPGGNFGKVDGAGPAARFNYPNGIGVHSSGDVYLADSRGNTIRRISPDGVAVKVAGSGTNDYIDGGASVASVNYPFGIALAPDRTVYFCEQQLHTVRVLKPDGSIVTIAGSQGNVGSSDGVGTAARFNLPSGIARDADGNLFIADSFNHTIRRIAAGASNVTTFAGAPGVSGSADGSGSSARFSFPQGLSTDTAGNVYVADGGNSTIRKITRAGVVTTVAGAAGVAGSIDGDVSVARFVSPMGIAIDSSGRIFVADAADRTIRRIDGETVTTIGGMSGVSGWADGLGRAAWFSRPSSVAVDSAGALYVSDSGNNLVEKGQPEILPIISSQPQALATAAGGSATFAVGATGVGLSYQWKFNGILIPGATAATYTVTNVQTSSAGSYSVEITNSAGTVSASATLAVESVVNVGRLLNLSVLTSIDAPGDSFTMGYVVGGAGTSGAKSVVLRAAGPSLGALGVSGTLNDPKMETFADTTKTGENDNWGGAATLRASMEAVGAFPYTAANSRDAAIVANITTRDNSIKISASDNGTGVVIAEIYDATPSESFTAGTPRLVNVSVLKNIGSRLTAGFVIGGTATKRVLVRAIGPTIGAKPFNVPDTISDPQIALFDAKAAMIDQNNDWGGTVQLSAAFTAVGAFALPSGSKDAALLATLNPGNYTVEVTGVGGTTGIALIEIYEVP